MRLFFGNFRIFSVGWFVFNLFYAVIQSGKQAGQGRAGQEHQMNAADMDCWLAFVALVCGVCLKVIHFCCRCLYDCYARRSYHRVPCVRRRCETWAMYLFVLHIFCEQASGDLCVLPSRWICLIFRYIVLYDSCESDIRKNPFDWIRKVVETSKVSCVVKCLFTYLSVTAARRCGLSDGEAQKCEHTRIEPPEQSINIRKFLSNLLMLA